MARLSLCPIRFLTASSPKSQHHKPILFSVCNNSLASILDPVPAMKESNIFPQVFLPI